MQPPTKKVPPSHGSRDRPDLTGDTSAMENQKVHVFCVRYCARAVNKGSDYIYSIESHGGRVYEKLNVWCWSEVKEYWGGPSPLTGLKNAEKQAAETIRRDTWYKFTKMAKESPELSELSHPQLRAMVETETQVHGLLGWSFLYCRACAP